MTPPNVIGKPNNESGLPPSICLRRVKGFFLLSPLEIIYLEAADNYSWVYTCREPGKFITTVRLHQLADALCGSYFCRIHRSFIVCTRHITEIDRDKISVRLDSGAWLPIGRSYQKTFFQQLFFC